MEEVESRKGVFNMWPKFFAFGLFLFFAFVLINFTIIGKAEAASAPNIITYQGKLLISGKLATTTQNIYFILYNASTGGSAVYTASGTLGVPQPVAVYPTQGLFTVNFGDTGTNSLDPAIFANDGSVYLEVRIGGDTLTPRKRITAAPYAFNAKYLDGYGASTGHPASNYIPVSDASGNFVFNSTTVSTSTVNDLTVGNSVSLPAGSIGPSELANTTVTATTYGANNKAVTFTVDADGRLTYASSTLISLNANQITAGTISAAQGGTGQDSSAWTGFVKVTGGTWATSSISLASDVSGTLGVSSGGTGSTTVGAAGSISYSNGTIYAFTAVGSAGQILQSAGAGTPVWVNTSSLGFGSGSVGSGTQGQMAYYAANGTNVVGTSSIFIDTTGNVGIGSTTPQARLTVADGAILAAGTVGNTPVIGAGTRFMWVPALSSIRAGYVDGTQWDPANIGAYSSAFGYNTIADGNYSTAFGYGTVAGGLFSTTFGYNTNASGYSSLAGGYLSVAKGVESVAIGNGAAANADYSAAFGWVSTASGTASFATGYNTLALGEYSTAMGYNTHANGNTSTAMGANITVAGDYSFGIGLDGSGANLSATSTFGIINGAFIASGTIGNTPAFGAGTRMMWIPAKAAFRAGSVNGTQWDTIGQYSFAVGDRTIANNIGSAAFGFQTTASGVGSMAMGAGTVASGDYSTAISTNNTASGTYSVAMGGSNNVASGNYSVAIGGQYVTASGFDSIAMGTWTVASGMYSTAMGYVTVASGVDSTAMGYYTSSTGNYSTALGRYITVAGTGSVGIGLSTNPYVVSASSVMSIMGGRVGIGTTSPSYHLDVYGDINTTGTYRINGVDYGQYFIDSAGAAGQIWMSDGVASGTWANTSTLGFASSSGSNSYIQNQSASDQSAGFRITSTGTLGAVGINTTSPNAMLTIIDGAILAVSSTNPVAAAPVSGAGTRLMWIPGKAAFRAGAVGDTYGGFFTTDGTEWNDANLGAYSAAFGINNIASGIGAFTAGIQNSSTLAASIAMGMWNFASGTAAVALGSQNIARGDAVMAIGGQNTVLKSGGMAIGGGNYINGYSAKAFGTYTTSTGDYAMAIGNNAVASGNNSFGIGNYITSSNNNSFGIGNYLTVSGQGSVGIGIGTSFADVTTSNVMSIMGGNVGIGTVNPAATLDISGNITLTGGGSYINFGTTVGSGGYGFRTNGGAMEYKNFSGSWTAFGGGSGILSGNQGQIPYYAGNATTTLTPTSGIFLDISGNFGVNTTSPAARFTVADGAILAAGTTGATPISGAGTRLMWIPNKAAFRAGSLSGSGPLGGAEWNATNIGPNSVAMGYDTVAGDYSFAMGYNTIATGSVSAAFGYLTRARGMYSTAMGYDSVASGDVSIAMGNSNIASGQYSTAIGSGETASANYATAIGMYSTVSGQRSNAIGAYLTVSGTYAAAMGSFLNVTGDYSFGIGLGDTFDNGTLSATSTFGVINGAILASGTIGNTPASGPGTRLMWIPSKAAFRAGYIDSSDWDGVNIGTTSFAAGWAPKASGNFGAVALGYYTRATGLAGATAMGEVSEADGDHGATAFGYYSGAHGDYGATALGYQNSVYGSYGATAIGAGIIVRGTSSVGIALDAATEDLDVANTMAIMGGNVGIGTTIPSSTFMVVGTSTLQNVVPAGPYAGNMSAYNLGASTTRWNSVWAGVVNIGTSSFSIAQNGNSLGFYNQPNGGGTNILNFDGSGRIGINTTSPLESLTIYGQNFVAAGEIIASVSTTAVTGTGTRMLWIPGKAAFRAGSVGGFGMDGTIWDNQYIGYYSFAAGVQNTASGQGSFVGGFNNIARGQYSSAFGGSNIASSTYAFAIGNQTQATGSYSFSLGYGSIASGGASMAGGYQSRAIGSYSLAFGSTAIATGSNSIALGNGAKSEGDYSVALGQLNSALGIRTFAGGYWNTVSGDYSAALGYHNYVSGTYSAAIGANNKASTSYSYAFGQQNNASGTYAMALGNNITVIGDGVVGVGLGNGGAYTVNANNAFVVMGGTVGISTSSPDPAYQLAVTGNVGVDGAIIATGVINQSTPLDLAERYRFDPACTLAGDCPSAGDLVCLKDGSISLEVEKCSVSYNKNVIGIVSANPGFLLTGGLTDGNSVPIALSGRVPVKVSTANGAIHAGDKLTSSADPGVAVLATEEGTTVGTALEDFSGPGAGTIMIYTSIGWNNKLYRGLTLDEENHKLIFPTTSIFESNVGNFSGARAFVFNAPNFDTSTADQYVISLRSNNTPVFSVSANGDVNALGNYYGASAVLGTSTNPGDLAERVDIAIDDSVEAGDVMMVDPNTPDTFRRTSNEYEQTVAGVISTNPTLIVGNGKTDYKAVLAMVGRVPVKVTGINGSIKRGDLLVASSLKGYAMKYDPAEDNSYKMVSIVGIALENQDEGVGVGKVMSLIRTGWIYNRDQILSTLQDHVQQIAAAEGINLSAGAEPGNLNVNSTGGQLNYIGGVLDLNNNSIVNIASIIGANNKWKIDEDGNLIQIIATVLGNKETYGLRSSNNGEIVITGTSTLENGMKRVVLSDLDQQIINKNVPIQVQITMAGETKGVYVAERSFDSFTVKENENGTSNAPFDWTVIAKVATSGVAVAPVQPAEQPATEPPAQSESPAPSGSGIADNSTDVSQTSSETPSEPAVETAPATGGDSAPATEQPADTTTEPTTPADTNSTPPPADSTALSSAQPPAAETPVPAESTPAPAPESAPAPAPEAAP